MLFYLRFDRLIIYFSQSNLRKINILWQVSQHKAVTALILDFTNIYIQSWKKFHIYTLKVNLLRIIKNKLKEVRLLTILKVNLIKQYLNIFSMHSQSKHIDFNSNIVKFNHFWVLDRIITYFHRFLLIFFDRLCWSGTFLEDWIMILVWIY